MTLTADHRATAPGERARIVAAGGTVDAAGRAEGMMEVSRTFGDVAIKARCGRAAADPANAAISPVPDVRVHLTLEAPRDELLFLACDGLWSGFSPINAATFLRTRLHAGHSYDAAGTKHDWPGLEGCVKALVDDAIHTKSCTDNVSVIALRFTALPTA